MLTFEPAKTQRKDRIRAIMAQSTGNNAERRMSKLCLHSEIKEDWVGGNGQ